MFLLLNGAYIGKKCLYYRNALGFSTGSWSKDISFPGCHLICSNVKLELLNPRHSSPGCPGILANSDVVQKCSHVRILLCLASTCLVGTPCTPLSCICSLAFSFRQCHLMGRLTSCSHWRGVWAHAWAFERSNTARDKWILSPAAPQIQGSVSSRFESYIRSQCHFLAPLILSAGNLSSTAGVAAPVLKEFVSTSPGTNPVWIALQYLFQLKILTKTFCPYRTKEFLCWDAFGGNCMLPGLGR